MTWFSMGFFPVLKIEYLMFVEGMKNPTLNLWQIATFSAISDMTVFDIKPAAVWHQTCSCLTSNLQLFDIKPAAGNATHPCLANSTHGTAIANGILKSRNSLMWKTRSTTSVALSLDMKDMCECVHMCTQMTLVLVGVSALFWGVDLQK